MAKFIVLATAGFFLLYGLAFAFVPEQFSLLVTQSAPQSPSGLIEFRATFGGMTIAVGVLLALTTRKRELFRFGVVSVLVIMLLMAASRSVGILLDGPANTLMYIYLVAELATAALATYALKAKPNSAAP